MTTKQQSPQQETYRTREEAAAYLDVKPQTLAVWKMRGEGPPYTKVGRKVRYPQSGLDAWLAANTVTPAGS